MFHKVMFVGFTVFFLVFYTANCSGLQKRRLQREALPSGVITSEISPRLKQQVEGLIQDTLADIEKMKGDPEVNKSLHRNLDHFRNQLEGLQQIIRNHH